MNNSLCIAVRHQLLIGPEVDDNGVCGAGPGASQMTLLHGLHRRDNAIAAADNA